MTLIQYAFIEELVDYIGDTFCKIKTYPLIYQTGKTLRKLFREKKKKKEKKRRK